MHSHCSCCSTNTLWSVSHAVRDKYSLCCSPQGWPRRCAQCPAAAVVPGEPPALLVQPGYPRRGSCPAVQPHSVSVTSLPDRLRTAVPITVPVLLPGVEVPLASYRITESITKVRKDL